MHKNAKLRVKLPTVITEPSPLHKGIMPCDTLSPYLFNLYLNGVHGLFNDMDVTPTNLTEQLISSFVYADELLIISKTHYGLQTSLNKL